MSIVLNLVLLKKMFLFKSRELFREFYLEVLFLSREKETINQRLTLVKKHTNKKALSAKDQEVLIKTVAVLNEGGLILYPSDTVWGLGCDATNDKAVETLFALKGRENNKAMLILLDEERKLSRYVEEIPEVAWDIIEASEKPITIIYPKGKNLAKKVCAQDGSIGIRLIKEDDFFLTQVLRKFKKPIVSTSANKAGESPGENIKDIDVDIKKEVNYIVNLETTKPNKAPSSIIKIGLHGEVTIIRK